MPGSPPLTGTGSSWTGSHSWPPRGSMCPYTDVGFVGLHGIGLVVGVGVRPCQPPQGLFCVLLSQFFEPTLLLHLLQILFCSRFPALHPMGQISSLKSWHSANPHHQQRRRRWVCLLPPRCARCWAQSCSWTGISSRFGCCPEWRWTPPSLSTSGTWHSPAPAASTAGLFAPWCGRRCGHPWWVGAPKSSEWSPAAQRYHLGLHHWQKYYLTKDWYP